MSLFIEVSIYNCRDCYQYQLKLVTVKKLNAWYSKLGHKMCLNIKEIYELSKP